MGVVTGTLFRVEDYGQWMKAYERESRGLIISLRNVDAPQLALIFEASQDMTAAEERVAILSDSVFLEAASSLSDPVYSFYSVEYFDPIHDPPVYFFAISYRGGQEVDWPAKLARYKSFFKEKGIEPAGVGSNPLDKGQVYMLFRMDDFLAFRKSMNSPRKMSKFIDDFDLPGHTLFSYWVKTSKAD